MKQHPTNTTVPTYSHLRHCNAHLPWSSQIHGSQVPECFFLQNSHKHMLIHLDWPTLSPIDFCHLQHFYDFIHALKFVNPSLTHVHNRRILGIRIYSRHRSRAFFPSSHHSTQLRYFFYPIFHQQQKNICPKQTHNKGNPTSTREPPFFINVVLHFLLPSLPYPENMKNIKIKPINTVVFSPLQSKCTLHNFELN